MITAFFAGILSLLLVIALFRSLTGFEAQKPDSYAALGPTFDPRIHLNGPILCEGVIYGPFGRVTSRFVAEFVGTWQGNSGTLREHFRYDSGAEQHREWRLTLDNDGQMRAEADDLVGLGHVLSVTDWMYLTQNGTIMNRSQFRKFGIKVAELVATMRQVTQ
jgi:hypothetical protein